MCACTTTTVLQYVLGMERLWSRAVNGDGAALLTDGVRQSQDLMNTSRAGPQVLNMHAHFQ